MTRRSPFVSLLPAAFALAGILLLLNLIAFAFGQAPLAMLRLAAAGTWGSGYGIGQVLFKATPLIFTGLAFEVGLRAGLFNIGGEGQLAAGSIAAGYAATKLPASLPHVVAFPIVIVIAMATGALVALPPAVLRARLKVHEIITTIMMNRIVDIIVPFVLVTLLGASSLRTADAAPGALITKLDRVFSPLAGSASSFAFVYAVVAAFAVHIALRRTRAGREMRWIGINANACRAEGIDVPKRLLQAMLVSGALAGAVAAPTVLGYKGYYELGLGSGAGFAGVAVALLGRGRPLGMVMAALLLGTIEQAGLAINAHVPKEAATVLQAFAILFVAIGNRAVPRVRGEAGA